MSQQLEHANGAIELRFNQRLYTYHVVLISESGLDHFMGSSTVFDDALEIYQDTICYCEVLGLPVEVEDTERLFQIENERHMQAFLDQYQASELEAKYEALIDTVATIEQTFEQPFKERKRRNGQKTKS